MSRIALVFLLSVGAFVACEGARVRAGGVQLGSNPMASIRLRAPAINILFKSISKLAGKYANKVPVPDVSATVSGVDIETRDLRVTHFAEPVITYTLSAPNSIKGSLALPAIGVQGPFNATRRTFIKTQHDSGLLVFNASDVTVAFQAVLEEFENGAPKIGKFACQANLGPANLNVKNAKEKFAIEVMGLAAKTFRPIYNSQVCATVERLVSNQVNRLLARIPNVLEVNKNLALKFNVQPQVSSDYVQLNLRAKVLTEQVSPFQAAPFVESPSNDAFVVLLVSDAPFNDLAYQIYANNKLGFTVNKDSHPLVYSLIQLKCDPTAEACLGNVVPSLAPKYGSDADVQTTFRASKAPEVEFVQDKAIFRASFAADLDITPTNGSGTVREANAAVDLSGALQIRIHEGSVYAKIDVQDVTVHIDEERNKKWEDKIRGTIEKVVEESINGGILLKGLPLRLPFGIDVTDPLIKFAPHTLQAHTGFDYKAKASGEDKGKGKGNH